MIEPLALYEVNLQSENGNDFFHLLSAQEQQFAQNIRNENLKNQHITVRVVVRQILAKHLNQAAAQIAIVKNQYGKPYLVDFPDVEFNISHSGDTLLMAISYVGAVGVDIEQAKFEGRNFSGLVKKCFAPSEQDYWNSVPEQEKTVAFYRFWTRKEAFVKAVGRGIALDLQTCVIAEDKKPYFAQVPKNYGLPSDWQIFDLPLKTNLYGAVVISALQIPTVFELPNIINFQINSPLEIDNRRLLS